MSIRTEVDEIILIEELSKNPLYSTSPTIFEPALRRERIRQAALYHCVVSLNALYKETKLFAHYAASDSEYAKKSGWISVADYALVRKMYDNKCEEITLSDGMHIHH